MEEADLEIVRTVIRGTGLEVGVENRDIMIIVNIVDIIGREVNHRHLHRLHLVGLHHLVHLQIGRIKEN